MSPVRPWRLLEDNVNLWSSQVQSGRLLGESSRRQSRESAAMASDPRPRAQRSSPAAVTVAENSRGEPGRAAGDRRVVRPDARGERCEVCDSPKCLALVRADEPPADWKDLVDRWAMLICSGHWSWRKTANLIVTLSCMVLLLGVCIGNKVSAVVEFLSASPLRWGSCAGCCVLGAVVGIWRVRRDKAIAGRREPRSPADHHCVGAET
jgi:hypothetical protein